WRLSFGDGTPDATGSGAPPAAMATHDYPDGGVYTATLTVTDSNGASASAPYTILARASLKTSVVGGAPGSPVTLTGAGYGPGEPVDVTIGGQTWAAIVADSAG